MEWLFHGSDHACRVTLTNLAIALHLTSCCSFRRFKNSRRFERSKAIERLERLKLAGPCGERSEAIERLERLELASFR